MCLVNSLQPFHCISMATNSVFPCLLPPFPSSHYAQTHTHTRVTNAYVCACLLLLLLPFWERVGGEEIDRALLLVCRMRMMKMDSLSLASNHARRRCRRGPRGKRTTEGKGAGRPNMAHEKKMVFFCWPSLATCITLSTLAPE